MTKQQTLDEKIEKMLDEYSDWIEMGDTKKPASDLKQLILAEVLKAMPEKRKRKRQGNVMFARTSDEMWNQALDQYAKNIREVLEGGEK